MTAGITARRRPGTRLTEEVGISLVEVMVTLTLMSTLFLVFGQSLIATMRVSNVENQESQSVDALRTELARLERELRWADQVSEPDPATATGTPPQVAGRSLTFETRNGVGTTYEVRYEVAAVGSGRAELRRTVDPNGSPPGTTVTLIEDLVDSATPFSFFPRQATDRNGYVDIDLAVQVDSSRDPRSISTRISTRNLF